MIAMNCRNVEIISKGELMFVKSAKRTLSLFVVLLLSLVTVGTALADTEKAKENYNKGIEYKKAGNLDAAVIVFTAARSEDPEYIDAWIQLGACYYGLKEYQKALESFTRATEKAPTNAEAFANLGRVQMHLKKYEKAQATLQTAVSLAPDDAAAQLELCKAYHYGRKYGDVISVANKLHEAGGGNHTSWFILGKGYQKTDKPTKAIPALKKSIELKSNYYSPHFALGSIYLSQRKYGKAASAFKAALKAKPTAYRASYNYAVAVHSGDSEDYATIIKVYEAFIKLAKKNPRAKTLVAEAREIVKVSKVAQEKANLQ